MFVPLLQLLKSPHHKPFIVAQDFQAWTAKGTLSLSRHKWLEERNLIYREGAQRALIWPRFRGQWRELTQPSARPSASVSEALELTRLSVHEDFKHPFDFSLRAIFN